MAEATNAVSMMAEDKPPEETVLLERLKAMTGGRKGNFAVHIHLSQLRAQYRQPHYMRIATRAFNPLIHSQDAVLYVLDNLDLVLLCREVPVDSVDEPILKLRALYSEDPLTFGEEGSLDDRFCTWYDLAQAADFASFVSVLEDQIAETEERRRKRRESRAARQTMAGEPLEPSNLVEISQKLQSVRVGDLIQQQSAVKVEPKTRGEILFKEYFVSMAALQQRVAPKVNLFSNPPLFQFLTETIDRRLLSVLSRLDFATLENSISINLNLSTVTSSGFHAFHDAVGKAAEKVVIEVQVMDIFADIASFRSTRDWLREHGYRVLADGLNPMSLQFFEPGLLETDFVKVAWAPDLAEGLSAVRTEQITDVVNRTGKDSVILTRVDSEVAVRWGLNIGIRRFQGRFVDRIIETMINRDKN